MAEEGEWKADIDIEFVSSEAKDIVKTVCYATEGEPVKQVHHGLAHVLAGIALLSGGGLYRHVARKLVDNYFDSIFGRLN